MAIEFHKGISDTVYNTDKRIAQLLNEPTPETPNRVESPPAETNIENPADNPQRTITQQPSTPEQSLNNTPSPQHQPENINLEPAFGSYELIHIHGQSLKTWEATTQLKQLEHSVNNSLFRAQDKLLGTINQELRQFASIPQKLAREEIQKAVRVGTEAIKDSAEWLNNKATNLFSYKKTFEEGHRLAPDISKRDRKGELSKNLYQQGDELDKRSSLLKSSTPITLSDPFGSDANSVNKSTAGANENSQTSKFQRNQNGWTYNPAEYEKQYIEGQQVQAQQKRNSNQSPPSQNDQSNDYDGLKKATPGSNPVLKKPITNKQSIKGDIIFDQTMMPFYFVDLRSNNYCFFNAYITSIGESYAPNWSRETYFGRTEGVSIYSNTDRTISIAFTIAAESKTELIYIYKKMQWLAQTVYPKYRDNNTALIMEKSPIIRMRVGDLFKYQDGGLAGYLTGFSPEYELDAGWEIRSNDNEGNNLFKVPKKINVSLDFTVIHDYMPDWSSPFYDGVTGNK